MVRFCFVLWIKGNEKGRESWELRGLVVDRLPLAILYLNCNFWSYGVHISTFPPSHSYNIFLSFTNTYTNATITQKGDDLASTMKQRFSPPGEMGPDQEMISLSKYYLLMMNVAQVRYNVAVYVFDINPPPSSPSLLLLKSINSAIHPIEQTPLRRRHNDTPRGTEGTKPHT